MRLLWLLVTKFIAHIYQPAMPASPIASNYTRNEQWAPLAVYGKRAPLRRKLRGQHKLTRKAPKTTRKATPWTRTSWLPEKADRPKHGGLTPWWCVAESRTEWPKEKESMFTTKPGFSLAAGKTRYQWARRGSVMYWSSRNCSGPSSGSCSRFSTETLMSL